jgi:outer membrane scaffolding protein for murein synthesis (MipA/OmpV family)
VVTVPRTTVLIDAGLGHANSRSPPTVDQPSASYSGRWMMSSSWRLGLSWSVKEVDSCAAASSLVLVAGGWSAGVGAGSR